MSLMAEESEQVKRARRKLKRKMEEEDREITPEALERVVEEIYLWISKHSGERLSLKDQNISLFDENQHVSKISNRSIARLREMINREIEQESGQHHPLQGRIKLA